jgi:hypothetical protein
VHLCLCGQENTYIVHASAFVIAMGEGTGVSKTASLCLLEVAAQSSLVLDIGHLVLVPSLVIVEFLPSTRTLIGLIAGPFLLVAAVSATALLSIAVASVVGLVSASIAVSLHLGRLQVASAAIRLASVRFTTVGLRVCALSLAVAHVGIATIVL